MTSIKLSMPKLTFLLAFMIAVFLIHNGNNAFGGQFDKIIPKTSAGGTTVTRGDVDQLYFLVSKADKLLQESVDIVFEMVANKKQRQEIEIRRKAVENIKDPQEREAKIQEINNDKQAVAEQNSQSEEASRKVAVLSAEQRQSFVNATYNTLLAGLMDREAVRRAQQLSQAIQSNPSYAVTFVNDLDKTKNIMATLPSQADKTIKLGNNLIKLAQANKIETAIPKSFSEKPRDVDLDDKQPTPSVKEAKDTQSPGGKPEEVDLEDSKPSPSTKEVVMAKSSPENPKEVGLRDRQPSQGPRSVFATWTFIIVRSDAGNEFPVVTDVKKGDKLLILREKGEWLNVKLESGRQGWVNKKFVK